MRDKYVKLEGYHLLDVKECSMRQRANGHGMARIVGHIAPEDEDQYVKKSMEDTQGTIIGVTENGGEFVLFQGVIVKCEVQCSGQAKLLEMELISTSYLLDLETHIRSFQDNAVTYGDVIREITSSYRNEIGRMEINADKALGSYLVQYKETDWAFLLRMAARMGTYVLPNVVKAGIRFGFMGDDVASTVEAEEYRIVNEKGKKHCVLKSRDYYGLGTQITFLDEELYAYQVDSILEGEEMHHSYLLKRQNEFACEEYENPLLTGVSLEGHVTDVKEDKVQVELDRDVLSGTKKWFSYATIYSSPDGTGWYCMPENGDCVRTYFPDSLEENAYVLSSVHVDGASNGARSNPDEKSIKSKYGKEILFKPDSLLITNNKGMFIEIDDNEGISIFSDKNIELSTKEDVRIVSVNDAIRMIAKDQILLQQNDSYIAIKDDVIIDGGQVKLV